MADVPYTPDQMAAIDAAVEYVNNFEFTRKEVFRLFGYAGTGKTTILKAIRDRITRRAMFMASAGKAAMVLRTKGCDDASTIHKRCYDPRGQAIKHYQDDLALWESMPEGYEKIELGKSLDKLKLSLNRPSFVLKDVLEFPKDSSFFLDEVSQVGRDVGEDMISFGFPIIACGDPFQLPPIQGEGFFTNAKPDILLTHIHRQEAGNAVLKLATFVRTGGALRLPYGYMDDSRVVRALPPREYREYDQVLCGFNKTRIAVNHAFRKMDGRTKVCEAGDKLICLQNNYEGDYSVMNGSTWIVESATPVTMGRFQYYRCNLMSLDFPGETLQNYLVHTMPFLEGTKHHQKFWTPMLTGRPEALVMTYGNAMTVHKAQGSQFGSVAFIDEWSRSDSKYQNHLYTGLTRAANRVTVIRRE